MKVSACVSPAKAIAIFSVCIPLIFPVVLTAQVKKKKQQHWEIGAYGGTSFITGDIPASSGYGGGVSLTRTISKTFSARLDYTRSINYGLDYRRRKVSRMSWESPYDPWVNYYGGSDMPFVANYRTKLHQVSAQAIASTNLQKLIGSKKPLQLYGYIGYSLLHADIGVDALDENMQPYNFSSHLHPVDFKQPRAAVLSALRKHMNLDFESKWGVYNNQSFNHYTGTTEHPVRHAASVGAGVKYGITNKVSLQLDYRLSSAFTDYLDGVTTGSKSDIHHFAGLGLTYKFGGTNGLKKDTDVPGITTIRTGSGNLKTQIHVVDPHVTGKVHLEDGDTSYLLTFDFVPIVPGKVTPFHNAYLRLHNGQWLEMPVHQEEKDLNPTKRFYYSVSLTKQQLAKLAKWRVTNIALETSTLQLEDEVAKGKQKLISRIAKKLLVN
ncbi:outer membrane protein [Aridibaculum aurantiacum]|uniref:outer membrane protein n=1 Tax=Aridibaculum aurantiacum TaxID=2810307 RepID=UPI001A958D24|nr:hypothetical protein [Aridibaculum aurantiacum]